MEYIVKEAVEEYRKGTPAPRTVIIDEAHQFIPEPAGLGFGAPGREQSYKIGLLMMQIRKYGISVILISQRTAVVAKSALSQCENLIAFRSVDQTGLDYLEAIAGGDVRNFLPQLKQGEALVFGPASSSDSAVGIEVAKPSAEENVETPEQIAALVEQINVYISTKEAPLSIEKIKLKEILRMVREEFSTHLNIRQISWREPKYLPEVNADRFSIIYIP